MICQRWATAALFFRVRSSTCEPASEEADRQDGKQGEEAGEHHFHQRITASSTTIRMRRTRITLPSAFFLWGELGSAPLTPILPSPVGAVREGTVDSIAEDLLLGVSAAPRGKPTNLCVYRLGEW